MRRIKAVLTALSIAAAVVLGLSAHDYNDPGKGNQTVNVAAHDYNDAGDGNQTNAHDYN